MPESSRRASRTQHEPERDSLRFHTDVFPREIRRIAARRKAASLGDLGDPPASPTTRLGLVGLALSGGGIRSSTFSLGVIQTLAKHGLFKEIDYLSTVSGGGYIGSCLTSLLNDERAAQGEFPIVDHDGENGGPTISYLRDNADYLSPRGEGGRLRIVAMVLRGTLMNLLLVLQAVLFAMSVTALAWWCLEYARGKLSLAECDETSAYHHAMGTVARFSERADVYAWAGVFAAVLAVALAAAVLVSRLRAAQAKEARDAEPEGWISRERRELWLTRLLLVVVASAFCFPMLKLVGWAIDTPWDGRHGLKAMWSAAIIRYHLVWYLAGFVMVVGVLVALPGAVGRWTRRIALSAIGVLGPGAPLLIYLLLCVRLIESPYINQDLMEALRDCAADTALGCGWRAPTAEEWLKLLAAHGLNAEGKKWEVRIGEGDQWIVSIDGQETVLPRLESPLELDVKAALKERGIEAEGEGFRIRRHELGWVLSVNGKESPPFESFDLASQLRTLMLMGELEEAFKAKGVTLRSGSWRVTESTGFSFRHGIWRGTAPDKVDCMLGDGSSAPIWIVRAIGPNGARNHPLLFEQPPRVAAALKQIVDDCRSQRSADDEDRATCSDAAGARVVTPAEARELKEALGEEGLDIDGEIVGVRVENGTGWVVATDDGDVFPIVPERTHLHVRNLGTTVGLKNGRNGIAISLLLWLASIFLFRFVNVNKASLFGFYRDRLSRLFLIGVDRRTGEVVHRDDQRLSALGHHTAAPYHLINATLNLSGVRGQRSQSRRADFFVFSQYFVGSDNTGYCETADMEAADPDVNLGTAMAISAAAAAPNMGTLTINSLVFLMTLLNVRLAYWIPNPRSVRERAAERDQRNSGSDKRSSLRTRLFARAALRPGLRYLVREATGRLDGSGPYVNVSDGGHLENTGIYQLLRRRCKLIIAVDGEADPKLEFRSLMNLMRYARIDLGIEFEEVKLDPIRRKDGWSKEHWMLAKIRYSAPAGVEPEIGHLLYIKSSLTGDEPEYIRAYHKAAPNFPHQTTADQFFNETQFEVYRALGVHAATMAIRDAGLTALLADARDRRPAGDARAAAPST